MFSVRFLLLSVENMCAALYPIMSAGYYNIANYKKVSHGDFILIFRCYSLDIYGEYYDLFSRKILESNISD